VTVIRDVFVARRPAAVSFVSFGHCPADSGSCRQPWFAKALEQLVAAAARLDTSCFVTIRARSL
jgi:hypothetical protein